MEAAAREERMVVAAATATGQGICSAFTVLSQAQLLKSLLLLFIYKDQSPTIPTAFVSSP